MIIDVRLRPPLKGFPNLAMPYRRGRDWVPRRLRRPFPASAEALSIELLLREMEEAGITMGVVPGRTVTVPPLLRPLYPEESAAGQGVSNDDIAAIQREYPDKFIGLAGIDLADTDKAVGETERAIKELGLKGIAIEPGHQTPEMNVNDQRLYPLYAKCEELGVPLFITLSLLIGQRIDHCLTQTILLDEVATRFRRLPIVIAHASWPWVDAALGLAFKHRSVYLCPDFYLTYMPGKEIWAQAANDIFQDQFLFGSAYPVASLKESVECFMQLPLSEEARQKALYRNAARLFKLEL